MRLLFIFILFVSTVALHAAVRVNDMSNAPVVVSSDKLIVNTNAAAGGANEHTRTTSISNVVAAGISGVVDGSTSNSFTVVGTGNTATFNLVGQAGLGGMTVSLQSSPSGLAINSAVLATSFSASGTVAGNHSGDGSALTGLNATQLTSGTVPSARLTGDNLTNVNIWASSANVTIKRGDGVTQMTAQQNGTIDFPNGFTASGATITDGSQISALNAGNLTAGTVAAARGGAGTVNGILKANGAGVVSAAAFTDVNGLAPGTIHTNGMTTPATFSNSVTASIGNQFNGNGAGLTNIPAASINIPAVSFIAQQGIVDPGVISDLAGFCAELQKVGISTNNADPTKTNLVDAMFLQPRFLPNGTNGAKSWTGATITTSNITFSPWGASFGANAMIYMPITDSRTNTFVVVYRGYLTNFNAPLQQWMAGLRNSDPTKYTAQWYYNFNQGMKFTFRETNTFYASLGADSLICPWWVTSYDWTEFQQLIDQRCVIASTCSGTSGIYGFYLNGVQSKYGNTVTNFYLTNTAIVPNFALNTIQLGVDNLGPSGGFFGGYWRGEIAWCGVFNYPVTTNQMVGIYRALRWLEPETVNRVWWGDSQFSLNPGANSNAVPNYFQNSGAHTNEVCWRSVCQSGLRFVNWYTLNNSNQIYVDAPYGKVTRTEHYIQGGVNDFYGDGSSLNTVSNNLFSIADMDTRNLGIRPYVFTLMPVATNSSSVYTYTAAKEDLINGFNQIVITNSFLLSGVVRLDLLQGQTDLDTNLNTYSLDGLHMFGPTGFIMNRRIADIALGLEFAPIGNIVTAGNFPYTLKLGDYLVRCTTAAGNATLKLPLTALDAEVHIIKKISSDANVLTVDGNGHNIDGSATTTITVLNGSKTFQYCQSTGTWNVN